MEIPFHKIFNFTTYLILDTCNAFVFKSCVTFCVFCTLRNLFGTARVKCAPIRAEAEFTFQCPNALPWCVFYILFFAFHIC